MYEDKILQLILSNELTWEGLIREIVKKENMNPWDIDIVTLSSKYIDVLKELKKIDFKISGKFLLTAAILLRMKSEFLFNEEVPKELKQ
ncbi:MAG: segregation/condensation protein A, partial [Candidatus Nanoarchaeia archaeon]|nr:segregation/condensation protein A [Candidatus Jingweiarchaeum tengchongense]